MRHSMRIIWKSICFAILLHFQNHIGCVTVSSAADHINIGSVFPFLFFFFFYRSNSTVAIVCVPIVLTCGYYSLAHSILCEQRTVHIYETPMCGIFAHVLLLPFEFCVHTEYKHCEYATHKSQFYFAFNFVYVTVLLFAVIIISTEQLVYCTQLYHLRFCGENESSTKKEHRFDRAHHDSTMAFNTNEIFFVFVVPRVAVTVRATRTICFSVAYCSCGFARKWRCSAAFLETSQIII